MGKAQATTAFSVYAAERGMALNFEAHGDSELVSFAERLLAGALGAASAKALISSIVEGEALNLDNVMEILDETSEVMEYSRRLEEKSQQLESATGELRAVNERLKELDRLKDEFLSMVSHELRTPLTSIRAFSEILLSEPDLPTQERQKFLGIVVKETERLTRLINHVLDLAKIESGRVEWHMEPLDLCDSVEDALNAVSQLFNEKKIELTSRLPAKPVMVSGDRDRLIQVIINLLSNAAKFCDSEAGSVVLNLNNADAIVELEVVDNGPGIAKQHLDNLFDKFYQVKDQQGGKPKGTGLGLAISRLIIEHHGGRIWVESTLGQGSKFRFTLPQLDR
jgi:signal transduction histidine kinase